MFLESLTIVCINTKGVVYLRNKLKNNEVENMYKTDGGLIITFVCLHSLYLSQYWSVGVEYSLNIAFSASNMSYDVHDCIVLLNSPKLSLEFPCKEVGRILSFNLDKLLCVIIGFILLTKQLILCGRGKENLHTDKLAGVERIKVRWIAYLSIDYIVDVNVISNFPSLINLNVGKLSFY